MAKSVTKKKKTNRRLKRSVRRTIGALCMITAIIVAAIPFPESRADDGSGSAAGLPYYYNQTDAGVADTSPATFNNVTFDNSTDNENVSKDFAAIAGGLHGTAYTISNVSGDWQMDWQFKYYASAAGADGYLTKYNNQYQVKNIDLKYRVFYDYIRILPESYSKFYDTTDAQTISIDVYAGDTSIATKNNVYTLNYEYILDADDQDGNGAGTAECPRDGSSVDLSHSTGYNFFSKNLKAEYKAYKDAYEAWLADSSKNTKPTRLIASYADVYTSDAAQMQFLCDQVFGTGTDMSLTFVDERVYDSNGNAKDWNKIFVLQIAESSRPSQGTQIQIGSKNYYVDSNGFVANNYNTIKGIATNAFAGVPNVETMTMAEEISFIGNSAFENSFVQSIVLPMNAVVGNQAFKNCSKLTSVVIPEGVKEIGAEAFYGTSISSITIPDTAIEIGDGAFANCGSLTNVTFSGNSSNEKTVGDFAFYDCLKLNSVEFGESRVISIGDCAFAVSMAAGNGFTELKFPAYIEEGDDIGEYVFGNRTSLQNVTLPENLGASKETTLNNNMFYGCYNLACVEFPDTCYYAKYPADLFTKVTNEQFYVRGPKAEPASGEESAPRTSTWAASYLNGTMPIPYVYNENDEDFYEIKDEKYVSVIDQNGILISSQFSGDKDLIGEVDSNGYPVVKDGVEQVYRIPGSVGPTKVVGIAEGCFEELVDYIVALKIDDDSQITTIGNSVFSGADALKYIYIGDSVQSIGDSAFSDCPELAIAEIGEGVTAIGANAFKGCKKLTEISFDNPIGGASSFPLGNIGTNAFSTGGSKLTIYGLIDGNYGPFAWAMQPDNYMNKKDGVRVCYKSAKDDPQSMTVILDNSNNLATLVDYPKYNEIDSSIKNKLDGASTESMTPEEAAIVNAVLNVVVPFGVESVDSKGYFSSDSKVIGEKPGYTYNDANISTYFSDIEEESKDGLFGSEHNTVMSEFTGDAATESEKVSAGNDRLQSITLTSVKYLPENCFYSCEGLQTANLGSAMEEMDITPFRGCTGLTSIACENGNYACNNGILYENLDDGTTKLVECLASCGNVVGNPIVSVANNPELANVSEIAEQAFGECPYLTKVDLTGNTLESLDEIPDSCFEGSENLKEVKLGENIQFIGERAFADTQNGIEVYVYGHEVALGKEAFADVLNPCLISHEGAGVLKAAEKQGVNTDTFPADDEVYVHYEILNNAGQTIHSITEKVKKNEEKAAKKAAPDESEIAEYIPEGYELYGWVGRNGEHINDPITQETTFIAQIVPEDGIDTDGDGIPDSPKPDDGTGDNKPDDGTGDNKPDDGTGDNKPDDGTGDNKPDDGTGDTNKPDDGTGNNNNNNNSGDSGNDSNNNNDSNSGNSNSTPKKYTLTVVYGNGSGTYAKGTTVIISAIEPPAGKEFYKWTTNNTGVTITSATSAATTVKTTDSDAVVTATYRDKSSVSNNTVTRRPIGSSGTTVQISKPGISNTDKAYASVSGSTDNFVIKITESTEAANAVATALSNKYSDMNPIKYFAMDISLYDKNGNKVTNTNGLSVNVTMPIPDALVQYGGNNKVGAVVNGNVLEDLSCKFTTVDGIPCVTFTARHFSPYTIYVDTSNLSVNTLDSTPKTGDGIHPKWFLSIALACISIILFMKKDKAAPRKITA